MVIPPRSGRNYMITRLRNSERFDQFTTKCRLSHSSGRLGSPGISIR